MVQHTSCLVSNWHSELYSNEALVYQFLLQLQVLLFAALHQNGLPPLICASFAPQLHMFAQDNASLYTST